MDKKLELWEKELPLDKLALIAFASKRDVDHEVNARVDKQVYTINQALETSIAAALFDSTDLNIEEVEKIISKSNEYMKSSEEFLIKYGEDWIVKINEIKPRIKAESIKLLDQNKNQADAVKVLREIFKDVPTKDLVNIFKETKEEWCKKCPTIEKENKEKLEKKVSSNAITPKKENESDTEAIEHKNKLLKLKLPLQLEGENQRVYKVDKNCVEYEELRFGSLQDIEIYIQEFNKHIEEIKEAFSYM